MSSTSPRVLVIGAGTGGLALSHGLVRAGIDVRVFERDGLRTDGLHGYRVGIDPDGSRALHALLPPDLYDTFVATCARAPRWFNMITEQLREVIMLNQARRPGTRGHEGVVQIGRQQGMERLATVRIDAYAVAVEAVAWSPVAFEDAHVDPSPVPARGTARGRRCRLRSPGLVVMSKT